MSCASITTRWCRGSGSARSLWRSAGWSRCPIGGTGSGPRRGGLGQPRIRPPLLPPNRAIRPMLRRGWPYVLPAALFGLLAVAFYSYLGNDTTELPSALIDQPAPDFSLPPLVGGGEIGFSSGDLPGKVSLVN